MYEGQIISAIDSIPIGDDLAYLILTGKMEETIRDLVALELRKLLSDDREVAREWKKPHKPRCDLAILHEEDPELIVEFKHMYTFDPLPTREGTKSADRLPNMLKDDMKKRERQYSLKAEVLGVLLATHPSAKIDEKKYGHGLMKYSHKVNTTIDRLGGADAVLDACKGRVKELIGAGRIVHSSERVIGKCFGVDVRMVFWVVGP
jgi:hypothetical protein